jgi:hypothetical protein
MPPRRATSERDEPLSLSQEEVEAKAAGTAAAVTRRIRVHRPSPDAAGRAESNAAQPVSVSRREMAAIERKGVPSQEFTQRIERSSPPEAATVESKQEKDAPDRNPPRSSEKRGSEK